MNEKNTTWTVLVIGNENLAKDEKEIISKLTKLGKTIPTETTAVKTDNAIEQAAAKIKENQDKSTKLMDDYFKSKASLEKKLKEAQERESLTIENRMKRFQEKQTKEQNNLVSDNDLNYLLDSGWIETLPSEKTNEQPEETAAQIQESIDKLIQAYKQAASTTYASSIKDAEWFKQITDMTDGKSLQYLHALRSEMKSLVDFVKGNKNVVLPDWINAEQLENLDAETKKKIIDSFSKIDSGIAGKSSIISYFDQVTDGFENITNGFKAWKDATDEGSRNIAKNMIGDGMTSMSTGADRLMTNAKAVAEDLSVIFDDEGISDFVNGLAEALEGVMKVGEGVGKIISGDIAGGIVSIISGAATLLKNSKKVNKEHKETLKLLELQVKKIEHANKLAEINKTLKNESGTTVFGKDDYGNAKAAVTAYKNAVEAAAEANEKLNDVKIVTGSKKSGWGSWKKRKDVYSSLLDYYPEVIDEQGNLNVALATSIKETRKMSDAHKEMLQEAIDYAEAMETALSSMKDYLSGIFGDLGNTMSDALVDAFRNGSDAAAAFSTSVSNMLDQMAQDMIYSITIAPLLEEAQEEFLNIMQSEVNDSDKFRQYASVLSGLSSDVINQQAKFNKLLEEWEKIASQEGIELYEKTTRSATSKGVASATQDSIDELNGRITVMQQHTYDLRENSSKLLGKEDQNEMSGMRLDVYEMKENSNMLVTQASLLVEHSAQVMMQWQTLQIHNAIALRHLSGIETNTNPIPKMASQIDDIATRGIIIRG